MKTVGERIKQARLWRGISGEDLAKAVGYKTQSGIANLENRATAGGGKRLHLIAKALNVPVQWLLEGPDVTSLDQLAYPEAPSSGYGQRGYPEAPSTVLHLQETRTAYNVQKDWPFSFERHRYLALPGDLKARAEAYIMGMIESFERGQVAGKEVSQA